MKADAELTRGSLLCAKKYAEAIGPLEALLAAKPTGDAEAKAPGELAICSARSRQIDKAKRALRRVDREASATSADRAHHGTAGRGGLRRQRRRWSAELSGRLAAAGNSAEYAFKGKLGLGWSQFKAGKLPEAAATFDEVLRRIRPRRLPPKRPWSAAGSSNNSARTSPPWPCTTW